MKKIFAIFTIASFLFTMSPVNVEAITQNQIDAEVQIVCTDGNDNWFSGSGTIIDPKGIILTNRHVIEGAYQDICFVGFIKSISQEPDFYTNGETNLAEVKYYTTSNDMDAAILYLDNPTNKTYPYINIWNSNSNNLQLGEDLEVIGFPGVGGSTITYTSGDFSGYGSVSDGTQNYLKTTAWLGHGNSGGAAYKTTGSFVGIPTMSITINGDSMNYLLSINSIKSWLSGLLGSQYESQIIEEQPTVQSTNINLQDDITPPVIEDAPRDVFRYSAYDDNGNKVDTSDFLDLYVVDGYRTIEILMSNVICDNPYSYCLSEMDDSGVDTVYYSYSDNISDLLSNKGTEYKIRSDNSWSYITPKITFPNEEGVYYIALRFKDLNGNISNPYILTYSYETNSYLKLKNIKFYSDSNYSNMIGNYDFDILESNRENFKYCATRLSSVYIKWEYENNYQQYALRKYDHYKYEDFSAATSLIEGDIITTNSNKYLMSSLDKGGNPTESWQGSEPQTNTYNGWSMCYQGNCEIEGVVSSLLLKPQPENTESALEGKHRVVMFAYNPSLPFDFLCGDQDSSLGTNQWGHVYYNLKSGKSLIEDSIQFDTEQQKIDDSANSSANEIIKITPEDTSNIDMSFAGKQKGLILLQVERNGEAYYVYPDDSKKYFLGRPDDAFQVMRELGLGATHDFISGHTYYPDHVVGKILIDVEQNGEAYYIYPKDKKAYFLGRPADAFQIMRDLGLGITNSDLNKIPAGSL